MPLLVEGDGAPADAEMPPPLLPSPGKDPSRLLQDLFEHGFADPQIHSSVPYFDPTKPFRLAEPVHTHSWVMKSWDSLKNRPWNTYYEDSYLVAACEGCRMHLTLTAIITSEEGPICGSKESSKSSHHFHLESWTQSVRSSPSVSPIIIANKPEFGSFLCCHCPFSLQIEFWKPVVPESVTSTLHKRGQSSNSSINLLNRNKDSTGSASVANAYATLSTYVSHVLNGQAKNILTHSESPFARRVGTTPEILDFMTALGWERQEDHLNPPQWDEELHKGRLRRKLLEHAEIELVIYAQDFGRGLENKEKTSKDLGLTCLIVGFDAVLYRADKEMAKLVTAPWPRPGSLCPGNY
jgi:hypothetical protein